MNDTPNPLRFTGQPLDEHLVANVASLLDARNIPHVLWGNWLLTLFGVPTLIDGIALVIEDEALQQAYTTLRSAGFLPCSLGESCEDSKEKRPRFSPAPSEHLHISDDEPIMLFKKSEMLWNIPSLATVSSETTGKPDVILASDPKRLPGPDKLGRGGRFSSDLHPIRVPSAWRTVEACIMLLKRDRKEYGPFWTSHLCYMAEYVDNKDVLDEDDLEPTHKGLFTALKTGPGSPWDFL